MNLRDKILIEVFHQKLLSQGLGRETAGLHRDNLIFFANAYLEAGEAMELKEVDADTMHYFLSSWYPTKVKASRSELAKFISTFKKFYQFVCQARVVNRESRDEIMGVLARKKLYLARLQARRRGKNSKALRPARELNGQAQGMDSPFEIDQSLYLLVHNLSRPEARIILDFQLFLDYFSRRMIRLAPSTATLPKKDLQKLNRMFSRPEALPANVAQSQSQRLSLFYHFARCMDLFIIGPDMELLITPRTERLLELNPDQQLVILLDALWNRLRWSELEKFGAQGFSSWAQDQRGGFAELISRLPADTPNSLSGVLAQDRCTKMLANYLAFFEVAETAVMFALKEMGIVDYDYKPGRDPFFAKNHRGIASITLTKFGKRVMKYLARKGRDEMGGKSLIDLMEDGLVWV